MVSAGTTATVMATLPAPGSGAGWVTLASPVELAVLEGGVVIGTTTAARLMLPAGRHDLIVSSATLGFQAPIRVDVQAGKSGITTVSVPNGSVSINALPWATVSLDGRDLGTTPIANVDVPLGTHDIVLRHPQLGERRQSVLVTAKQPGPPGRRLEQAVIMPGVLAVALWALAGAQRADEMRRSSRKRSGGRARAVCRRQLRRRAESTAAAGAWRQRRSARSTSTGRCACSRLVGPPTRNVRSRTW